MNTVCTPTVSCVRITTLVMLSSCLLYLSACIKRDFGSSKAQEAGTTCESGALEKFGLSQLPFQPSTSDIPWLPPQAKQLLSPDSSNGLRLDVCFDPLSGGSAVLKRVVWLSAEIGQRQEFLITPRTHVKGLEPALFGDYSELELQVVDENGKGLLLKGAKQANNSFAVAGNTSLSGETHALSGKSLLVGTLINNLDPFTKSECKPEQEFATTELTLGSAKIFFDLCQFPDAGETYGYEIKKVRVIDTSESLLTENRKEFSIEASKLVPPLFEYRWGHHNACDSFALRLPHASYAATTTSAGGCGPVVADAPKREFMNDNYALKYRIKYGTSEWQPVKEGKDCMNFLNNRCK